MFAQYQFIEETHKVALESAVRNHTGLTIPLAAKLYRLALESASTKAGAEHGFAVSRIDAANYAVGTCTDTRSGIFVQLVIFNADKRRLLTVGTRWVTETTDRATGTTNFSYW